MQQTDAQLIAQTLDGDEQAFEQLVNRYKNGLYRHCLRFTKDESSAEDIALEAFVEAYKHMDSYNPNYKFSTWLYKIATNLALSSLRKRKDVRMDEDELDRVVSELPAAEELMFYNELHEAVNRLPLTYRTVVSMHYWQGKSYAEIAGHMGTSVGSVKGWMYRARKLLRGDLS